MTELTEAFANRRRELFIRELRRQYPAAAARSEWDLTSVVLEDEKTAGTLGITASKDLWRFLALRWSPELLNNARLYRPVVEMVLNNRDVPAGDRLDFLERQAVTSLREHPCPPTA